MTPPTPALARRRAALRFTAAATLAVVLTTAPLPAGAATTSPRDRLRTAAHGTLSSGFGTLQFRSAGTARFAVKECGFQPIRPGFVTTFTDCPPDTATGSVTVTDNGYQLRRRDGSTIRFTAYVDSNRQLHLGFGAIGRLAADRTGTVNVSPSEQLVVGTTGCRYVQAGAAQTIPCQFIQDGGRTILTYPAPAGAPGTGQLAGLVYLPDLRLVVSPDMVDRIYRRK
ncbi:MAG TPA: hypothetical protein VLV81_11405 [Acidimicrobiia bacterium]|nr:hypothetical protein [Acidimicrobiia bacterium]